MLEFVNCFPGEWKKKPTTCVTDLSSQSPGGGGGSLPEIAHVFSTLDKKNVDPMVSHSHQNRGSKRSANFQNGVQTDLHISNSGVNLVLSTFLKPEVITLKDV